MMIPEWFAPYMKGLMTMAALIIAIGIQNAFVLRQGLQRRAAFLAASICFACDVLLVILGTLGLGALFASSRVLSLIITWGGTAFLAYYGMRALHAAQTAKGLDLQKSANASAAGIALTALGVSLLNPHAIIDTVVLVGGMAARYQGADQIACIAGALTASGVWFYSLAYGARSLAPVLTRPKIWRVIDLIIGAMMLALAISLALDGLRLLRN